MADCVIPIEKLSTHKTLRHFLTMFPNGMPEDCIAIVLNSVIKGLKVIPYLHEGGEPEVNSSRIGVFFGNWEYCPHSIRLAYHENHMRIGRDDPDRPQIGLWGAGIVALELAYGSLPENISPEEMVTMADNLVRILRQKLKNDKKMIRHLPNSLEMLLHSDYVARLERKLKGKNSVKGIGKASIALRSLMRTVHPMVKIHEQTKSFSRGFLDVVMKCLDKENPTPINQILDLTFLKNVFTNDMKYFEKRMGGASTYSMADQNEYSDSRIHSLPESEIDRF